ncbi:nucleotide-binding domain containing protein [Metabacillus rhizolycopersici]|uniref:Four-carbon acid sugar kinase nucleotide binding domain-containing protein n=1 Tax=Metabacillus rhizolycopersici TaxID=2875709 RepID=A0ABS7UPN1_9BACI|nr:nucleotide-binding domain containing protein [Metabacillus rhizolycopersici]MBZ5749958.1 hypothetical protein [Metabacillus rhizolycopersici]
MRIFYGREGVYQPLFPKGTVSRKLGIKGNHVLEEIEINVSSGLAIGRNMSIVLKSGSFGKEDFLHKAIEHLKNIN